MRVRWIVFMAVSAAALARCASNSGVVPIGPDTFMVSRQAATGFSGLGILKAEALREAEQYCAGKGKTMQIVNSTESQPPYIFGNFPKAEVQFMCLSADDPELARPKMSKEADVVIESTSVTTSPETRRNAAVKVPIVSQPEGAEVYLDGVFVGNAPLPEFSITPGDHVIELKKQGFVPWTRTIRIAEGSPTRVFATLESLPK
jgi:PEGA domain-containing protein